MIRDILNWTIIIVAIVLLAIISIFYLDKSEILDFQNIAAIVTACGVIGVGIKFLISDYWGYKARSIRKEEAKSSLNTIVQNLSSEEKTTKLSSAIMLRRFLDSNISKDFPLLKKETVNVISSLLRVLPTGVFQKTLGDGLAYARNLKHVDLQRTNLQDIYLGLKEGSERHRRIKVDKADLYLADLSYALIENVKGSAIFYRSILFSTKIKNSNLNGADFREADLTNVSFKNVSLYKAAFDGARNVPKEIPLEWDEKEKKLICTSKDRITAQHNAPKNQTIFFSMPSYMTKRDELITKDYKKYLEDEGYRVLYYVKDDYPNFGQLNRIRDKISYSVGMVAFGFHQTHIHHATFRPDSDKEEQWKDIWLATPWNEIEVGMALSKGLPVLLVKDESIKMGVFDEHLNECFITTILCDKDNRDLAQDQEMKNWLSKLQKSPSVGPFNPQTINTSEIELSEEFNPVIDQLAEDEYNKSALTKLGDKDYLKPYLQLTNNRKQEYRNTAIEHMKAFMNVTALADNYENLLNEIKNRMEEVKKRKDETEATQVDKPE